LGDRIAIVGDGNLLCSGTSLFLKKHYGVGYCMTIEKKDPSTFKDESVMDVVNKIIPEAKLLTSVGTELTVEMPFSGSASFEPMFIEFDNRLDALGIQSYGMSVTTLEEVFLKVASGSHAFKAREDQSVQKKKNKDNGALIAASDIDVERQKNKTVIVAFEKYDHEKEAMVFAYKQLIVCLEKRYLYFKRDTKAWLFLFGLPVIFLLIGGLVMAFSKFTYPQPTLTLSVDKLNPGLSTNFLPIPFSNASTYCYNAACEDISGQGTVMKSLDNFLSYPIEGLDSATSIENVSQYLFDHRREYEASRYGAYTLTRVAIDPGPSDDYGLKYLLHANYTAYFAGPTFSALMAQNFIRTFNKDATLTARLHPLPTTKAQKSLYSSFNLGNLIFFILLAIPFAAAAFASFTLAEKENKTKDQQLISGVPIPIYWLASWIWYSLHLSLFLHNISLVVTLTCYFTVGILRHIK
jgi:ATP-binding cassette, subfamily A (ABC1), member 3